jgi:N-acetylmuramoyl-L-alanine amidase
MNPPPRPAAPTQHVISSGETLSQIAARYHINLSSLRRTNELRNDRIRIGQVLTIPPG